jgi:hypothetical protein
MKPPVQWEDVSRHRVRWLFRDKPLPLFSQALLFIFFLEMKKEGN